MSMTTDIERHYGNPVAITDERELARIPQLAERLAKSNMCPAQFKGKPDDIVVAGYGLADNGIRLSFSTLAQVYVIQGRPSYMAQIQSAMAALNGIDVQPVEELCDTKSATVEVTMPNGRTHRVSFTWEEAVRGNLAGKDTYKQFPAAMLVARATTRAVDRHCPAVKLGLAGSINMMELGTVPTDARELPADSDETGELISIAAAKQLVLDMLVAHWSDNGGSVEERVDRAKKSANLLWLSHKLPSGQGTMPRSRLEGILSTFDDAESSAPGPDQALDGEAQAESVESTSRSPQGPERVTPEIVDSPPSETGERLPLDEEDWGAPF